MPVASRLSGNSTTAPDWISDQTKCPFWGEHFTISLADDAPLLSQLEPRAVKTSVKFSSLKYGVFKVYCRTRKDWVHISNKRHLQECSSPQNNQNWKQAKCLPCGFISWNTTQQWKRMTYYYEQWEWFSCPHIPQCWVKKLVTKEKAFIDMKFKSRPNQFVVTEVRIVATSGLAASDDIGKRYEGAFWSAKNGLCFLWVVATWIYGDQPPRRPPVLPSAGSLVLVWPPSYTVSSLAVCDQYNMEKMTVFHFWG